MPTRFGTKIFLSTPTVMVILAFLPTTVPADGSWPRISQTGEGAEVSTCFSPDCRVEVSPFHPALFSDLVAASGDSWVMLGNWNCEKSDQVRLTVKPFCTLSPGWAGCPLSNRVIDSTCSLGWSDAVDWSV